MSTVLRFPVRASGFPVALSILTLFAVSFTTACGSSGAPKTPILTGNTQVTVLLTSTANAQLSEFDLSFQSITLTSQSGETVTLLPTSAPGAAPGAEFVQINGTAEPLVSASIPQDVYTAASVTLNGSQFVCVILDPSGGLATNTFNDAAGPAVTVTLPAPITVTGTSMGLSLALLVAQSATYSPSCYNPLGKYTFSTTPTFSLTPLAFSASPTNANNGKVTGLDGQITAIGTGGNSFTLSLPDAEGPRPVSVSSGSDTVYQGISSFSALAVGTFVDMDGAIQPDGSLLAIRIAVEDPSAVNVLYGPLLETASSTSNLTLLPRGQQGAFFSGITVFGSVSLNFGSAIFQVSGQLTNLQNLPFEASFDASNIVPGQNVYLTTATIAKGGPFPLARSMTLIPQTLNGTVTGSSTSGGFTVYTISLAPDDLFPALAVQQGQSILLTNPNQVEVYVDSNTQLLNSQALAAGSTFRFYGLVFNDTGTLRMDCAQVNDGVPFSAQSSSSNHMETGDTRTVRRDGAGWLPQTITVVTHSH